MATLALSVAGSAVGSALLPSGISLLGTTVSGALIGQQLGALAGSYVDQALFGGSGQSRTFEGPRLSDLTVTASSEGAAVMRLYGRARLGGQIIWATNFEEEVIKRTSSGGGGGGKGFGGGSGPTTTQIEYRYYANFAVALAEGEISSVGRVWADGKVLDLSQFTTRLYRGSEDQLPDSLIEAKEGAGNAPAYRGVAYMVFERLPLAPFGNRIPQLSFEVHRAVDDVHKQVRAVAMIPGSGEWVYGPDVVTHDIGGGEQEAENVHTRQGGTDWSVSLDQLDAALPNAKAVSLVVSWFGTDLRAGHCQLRPGVELAAKATSPHVWSVAGQTRASAHLISQKDGKVAYGGTPSDQMVVAAIQDLKARGQAVVFSPFVLMDVPDGNTLTDPYTGAASQPSYPWRGRISVDPAPGQAGSPDKTAAAATQLNAFIGTAQVADFSISGTNVVYSGPAEWSFRRMILHYAHLCKAAGGVDGFALCSELRGLSQVRASASSYPFVDALVALAADVRAVLGAGTKITYGADWSEYFGHQPADGSNDVYFHLDPLWASPDVDAVGIDMYWPLADWREGRDHLDWQAGTRAIHDLDYLKGNLFAGEGYDWYYASAADRDSQIRTPITDGAGKPWVFRFKDLKSWWSNAHYNRPGGVEAATPTAWTAQSKPVWFMELGCPAVDKGANQPNVFVDPKSAESALPHYSSGLRDDLIQRRYLQAIFEAFDPAHSGYVAGANPTSSVYGAPMIDLTRSFVYAWDARPWPAFPFNDAVWGDADNWQRGHWLNGRVASVGLDEVLRAILNEYGFSDYDVSGVHGIVPGFVIDRVMAAREAIQPLELAFFFDSLESEGAIRFRHRGAGDVVADLSPDDLVETAAGKDLFALTRAQETSLPATAKISYVSPQGDYRPAVAEARRLIGASGRVALADLPMVLDTQQAGLIAESWLFEAWASRERGAFALPPSRMAVESGDALALNVDGRRHVMRVIDIGDHGARDIEALSLDYEIYDGVSGPERKGRAPAGAQVGQPLAVFMDLPLLRGDEPPEAGYVAATMTPWPGGVAVYRAPQSSGYVLKQVLSAPAVMGLTLGNLTAGPAGRWDHATTLQVKLDGGDLTSVSELALFDGANAAAVQTDSGDWEIIQFLNAQLIGEKTYELSGLLRAQAGSDEAMAGGASAGARFVLLDSALGRIDMTVDEIDLPYSWRWGPANRDIGDASYGTVQHAFSGVGLRPLSPVHLRGTRNGAGDVQMSWLRRTRTGGDGWAQVEVPLGEQEERYEVDVLAATGGMVLRTLSATTPAVSYSAADQIADFGSVQASINVQVYQISASVGRGSAAIGVL